MSYLVWVFVIKSDADSPWELEMERQFQILDKILEWMHGHGPSGLHGYEPGDESVYRAVKIIL